MQVDYTAILEKSVWDLLLALPQFLPLLPKLDDKTKNITV